MFTSVCRQKKHYITHHVKFSTIHEYAVNNSQLTLGIGRHNNKTVSYRNTSKLELS